MKKVLFILSLLLGSMNFISAQTPLSFSKVINVDGVNDKQLYERLETFLTNAFNHPDKVIQLRDKENKSLTVKTSFIYKCIKKNAGNINRGVISYTINIACSRTICYFTTWQEQCKHPSCAARTGLTSWYRSIVSSAPTAARWKR